MEFDKIIQDVCIEWGSEFVSKLKTAAAPLPKLTGEGVQSFDAKVVKSKLTHILIAFQSHLRYYDMRKVTWDKVPNIDELKKWVEQKGVANFLPKFKEKRGYTPGTNEALINQIAWGIGISMKKRGKWLAKRQKWYNKTKEPSLNILYRRLLDEVSTEFIAKTKSALK